jgi:sugar-specific transcriptional regulator TrmB
MPVGKYCEIYGNTLQNTVLEYFLEAYDSDMAPSEIYMIEKISKPKVYQIIDQLMKKGYVVKSRTVGRTQMYKLNRDNPIVKIYIRNFKECLNMIFDEYPAKKKQASSSLARVAVSTRNV